MSGNTIITIVIPQRWLSIYVYTNHISILGIRDGEGGMAYNRFCMHGYYYYQSKTCALHLYRSEDSIIICHSFNIQAYRVTYISFIQNLVFIMFSTNIAWQTWYLSCFLPILHVKPGIYHVFYQYCMKNLVFIMFSINITCKLANLSCILKLTGLS